ncbi:hypothetical protein JDV02_008601 [Purpureocillium takamizusanense]|uniref:Peptidase M24 domain-containing protein n=1 Tax=Purpureocillium takamizusanense TaxID=2060973 RepID=A0A9Q8QMF1_9HYPO|nr:uncharacterized protein JDV02_008601 [Purpureocillium takamizusanense]UNI22738.1 hypothetical protein JDV02_008601 [Purpureocillium takamizusanense]
MFILPEAHDSPKDGQQQNMAATKVGFGEAALFEKQRYSAKRSPGRVIHVLIAAVIITALLVKTGSLGTVLGHRNPAKQLKNIQKCSIDTLHKDLSFLDNARPIQAAEFIQRRDRLARALDQNGVDAFVLEPGFTFQYYGNVSQPDWEPGEAEERPFLMLVLPQRASDGSVSAKTAFLAAHFEEGRARMLGIPSRDEELDIVIWEEHWNPYKTLLESRLFAGKKEKQPTLMVEEEMRDFIVRGLQNNGFKTVGLSPEAELVHQTKSPAEIEIIRAVNTGTIVAVRAVRTCLVPGLTEDEVTAILDNTLLSMGFVTVFNIMLFGEHGALPHGGFVTGGKKLTLDSVVIIDVGARYLGYTSDICRSFLIDPPKGRRVPEDPLRAEKEKIWRIVFDAQTAASEAMRWNNTAASVDIAARSVIDAAGYGEFFTHRVGHSIGIKAHESPYLNKWNTVKLSPGMTFTIEPGIYLEGKFGMRHEDIYRVTETGDAELLTGRRARGLYDP